MVNFIDHLQEAAMRPERNHMATLLNIQSSPRGTGSLSRILSQDFVAEWKKTHGDGTVVLRDLAETPLPFVGVPWIGGIFLPVEQRSTEQQDALKISDELIAELFAADHILLGTPMYNFTVPANLKAWIDLIVRPRVTHSGPPDRKGLVTGKRCTIIIASGGVYDEGLPSAASDYESGSQAYPRLHWYFRRPGDVGRRYRRSSLRVDHHGRACSSVSPSCSLCSSVED
jgi:FMN-dependent NADH-azoreductase